MVLGDNVFFGNGFGSVLKAVVKDAAPKKDDSKTVETRVIAEGYVAEGMKWKIKEEGRKDHGDN